MFANKKSAKQLFLNQQYYKNNSEYILGTKKQIVEFNKEHVALDGKRNAEVEKYIMSQNQSSFKERVTNGRFQTPEELYELPENDSANIQTIAQDRKLSSIEEESLESIEEQQITPHGSSDNTDNKNSFWQNLCCRGGDTGATPEAYNRPPEGKTR